MEENNLNENKIVENKGSNKALIGILIVIIILLLGFIIYTSFIKKEDDKKPQDNNTVDKVEENNTVDNSAIDNTNVSIVGRYVNNEYVEDFFILNADGTAEAAIVFTGPDLPTEDDKTYFTKDELTYKATYTDSGVNVELIPNDSLDPVYKQWFGTDGDYYYFGKIVNGVYEFEVVNPTAVANPGQTKFIKQ